MAAAAVAAASATDHAYKVARKNARQKIKSRDDHPMWLKAFAERVPEPDDFDEEETFLTITKTTESKYDMKKRTLATSKSWYLRCSWLVYDNITRRNWFEGFIMANIGLTAVAVVADLENRDNNASTNSFVEVTTLLTTVVFTLECIFKIVAEGKRPMNYFLDPADGVFNCFDFMIVVMSYAFMTGSSGATIGALRLLRLVRLLTFVKGVTELRVILVGLLEGFQSVGYIVMLLFLVMYMFGICACLFFGDNDPVRFGTVPSSMLSMFIVTVGSSWDDMAYTAWYGCDEYTLNTFSDANAHSVRTMVGVFPGFRCDKSVGRPASTFAFFAVFIVLSTWMISSLFIAVISMNMFEAFNNLKAQTTVESYYKRLSSFGIDPATGEIVDPEKRSNSEVKDRLTALLDEALDSEPVAIDFSDGLEYDEFVEVCRRVTTSASFNNFITLTIVVVGYYIGLDTEKFMACGRFEIREKEALGKETDACEVSEASAIVNVAALVIFALEALLKILAEGKQPHAYFRDNW